MAENRNSRDEKLIQELYDKLNWFTFEATDEEFDPDQVQTILDLLDKLDPLPERRASERNIKQKPSVMSDPLCEKKEDTDHVLVSDAEAAFERFKKKYNITEEDLARKNGRSAAETNAGGENKPPFPAEFSKELAFDRVQAREISGGNGEGAEVRMGSALANGQPVTESMTAEAVRAERISDSGKTKSIRFGRFVSTAWGKVAVALIIVIGGLTLTTVGTSAVKQKSFFETVKSGVNSVRIIVTGNEMESERGSMESDESDNKYYSSWEEVQEENPDILIPGYIPDGLTLNELYRIDMGNYIFYQGVYIDSTLNELLIGVKVFRKEYADMELKVNEKWIFLEEWDKIKYYQFEESYKALWKEEKCIYTIEWVSLDDINRIICEMK